MTIGIKSVTTVGIYPPYPNYDGGSSIGPGTEVELAVPVPAGKVPIAGGVTKLSGLGTFTSSSVPSVLESRPGMSSDGSAWDFTNWYVRVRNNASSGNLVVQAWVMYVDGDV
jgi:hypothetical protein